MKYIILLSIIFVLIKPVLANEKCQLFKGAVNNSTSLKFIKSLCMSSEIEKFWEDEPSSYKCKATDAFEKIECTVDFALKNKSDLNPFLLARLSKATFFFKDELKNRLVFKNKNLETYIINSLDLYSIIFNDFDKLQKEHAKKMKKLRDNLFTIFKEIRNELREKHNSDISALVDLIKSFESKKLIKINEISDEELSILINEVVFGINHDLLLGVKSILESIKLILSENQVKFKERKKIETIVKLLGPKFRMYGYLYDLDYKNSFDVRHRHFIEEEKDEETGERELKRELSLKIKTKVKHWSVGACTKGSIQACDTFIELLKQAGEDENVKQVSYHSCVAGNLKMCRKLPKSRELETLMINEVERLNNALVLECKMKKFSSCFEMGKILKREVSGDAAFPYMKTACENGVKAACSKKSMNEYLK